MNAASHSSMAMEHSYAERQATDTLVCSHPCFAPCNLYISFLLACSPTALDCLDMAALVKVATAPLSWASRAEQSFSQQEGNFSSKPSLHTQHFQQCRSYPISIPGSSMRMLTLHFACKELQTIHRTHSYPNHVTYPVKGPGLESCQTGL
jgi:hypothetical protein